MIYELNADRLHIKVCSKGAELQSLKRKDGTELLWQGDAKYWDGQSPLLFPFPGKSWDNKLRIDGEEYTMPKHGFACNMEFELVEQTDNSITLKLTDTPETLKMFPFRFELEVTYTVVGSSLNIGWKVNNKSEGTMYFMIGAHPAFNLPGFNPNDKVHGYIYTENAPDMQSNVVLPDGYCHDEIETVELNEASCPSQTTLSTVTPFLTKRADSTKSSSCQKKRCRLSASTSTCPCLPFGHLAVVRLPLSALSLGMAFATASRIPES